MMGFDDRTGKNKYKTKELHEAEGYKAKNSEYKPEKVRYEKSEDGTHRVVGQRSNHDYGHHSSEEVAKHHVNKHNSELLKYKGD